MTPEQIPWLLTAFLPEEEQMILRARAGHDPAVKQDIADSYRLRAAIDRGLELERLELQELAWALAMAPEDPLPGSWQARLRESLQAMPAWQAHRAEWERLDAPGAAQAQFNRLSGRKRPRRRFMAVAAALATLMLAHGAWTAFQDRHVRGVWMTYQLDGPVRGEAAAASDDGLAEARRLARESRTSVAGLWPRYDRAMLGQALAILGPLPGADARLEQARIQVLLGDPSAAAELLDGVQPALIPRTLRRAIGTGE